ncbi:hypothetical protein JOM56_000308 [Amanita muscaria]
MSHNTQLNNMLHKLYTMIHWTHAEHPLPNLPTELFDAIFNHLSDDKSSLRSCCLASRAFLPTAQALLFRRVVLYAYPLQERPHLRAGTKLRHLVELSHLLNHTREFQINGGDIDNDTWLGIDPELLPALEAFIGLKHSYITADCGRSLQYISLVQIIWHMSSPNLLNAALQRLLSLESVMHIMIGWSGMPLSIFEHFPSRVKILELAHITFRYSAQVPDGYLKLVNLPAIRPESLFIREKRNPDQLTVTRAIFNNPSRGCDGTSIQTLHVSGLNTHEFGTYVTLAPNVEKLTLEIRTAWQEPTPLDFSQFSRLRYLDIQMYATSHISIDRQIRWLAQSLGHVKPGNSFRSITLTYTPDEIYDILAWAELDSVLAGSQLESESFSGMTIELPTDLSSTDFYSFLPRTIDKKLLKVVNLLKSY